MHTNKLYLSANSFVLRIILLIVASAIMFRSYRRPAHLSKWLRPANLFTSYRVFRSSEIFLGDSIIDSVLSEGFLLWFSRFRQTIELHV